MPSTYTNYGINYTTDPDHKFKVLSFLAFEAWIIGLLCIDFQYLGFFFGNNFK